VRLLRDEDRPKAAPVRRCIEVVDLELVEPLEIESQSPSGAVNLNAHGVLSPTGDPRRLEASGGTRVEPSREHGEGVDRDGPLPSAVRPCPLGHEGLGQPRHGRDALAEEMLGDVDKV